MKALPALKLIMLVALAALMQVLATPAQAHIGAPGAEATAATTNISGPETSSVVLVGALGVMLMLRRRRLQA